MALVVANSVKANNVAELVALAKAGPQKMNYASAGIGSVTHLVMEVFRDGVGMDAVHAVQRWWTGGCRCRRGAYPRDLRVDPGRQGAGGRRKTQGDRSDQCWAFAGVARDSDAQRSGRYACRRRSRFWYGIFGPKGVPLPAKAKLERAVQTVMAEATVRGRLAKLDITPEFAPGPALQAKLAAEIRNWSAFVDAKQIKPE